MFVVLLHYAYLPCLFPIALQESENEQRLTNFHARYHACLAVCMLQ
jgi:hypothetical protein